MNFSKIKKNIFGRYIYEKKLHFSFIGPNTRFDWLIILGFSFVTLLILLYSSLSFFNNTKTQIKGDDFIPKIKTVSETQLDRVIKEIDSKNPVVVPIESLEVIDEDA